MSHHSRFQWQPNIRILIFVLLFLPVTLGLGFWQLERADEKAEILAEQQQRIQLPPLTNSELADVDELHLRRFQFNVEFDPERWFLLDNRVRDGRPGYEVLNLAMPAGLDRLMLVNRGWVPAELDRNQLPQVEIPGGEVEISGYFYAPEGGFFELGEQVWRGSWPERMQNADLDRIAERLGADEELFRLRLRLAADDANAYVAEWEIVNQLPQTHIGYAVQWFAMTLALLIMGIFANSNLGQIVTKKRD